MKVSSFRLDFTRRGRPSAHRPLPTGAPHVLRRIPRPNRPPLPPSRENRPRARAHQKRRPPHLVPLLSTPLLPTPTLRNAHLASQPTRQNLRNAPLKPHIPFRDFSCFFV